MGVTAGIRERLVRLMADARAMVLSPASFDRMGMIEVNRRAALDQDMDKLAHLSAHLMASVGTSRRLD